MEARSRYLVAPALLVLFAALANAQTNTPFSCNALSAVTPQLRSEGLTELVGDVLIQCTGGLPLPLGAQIPTANITLLFNGQVTSRLLGTAGVASASEAVLLVDDPGDGGTSYANSLPQIPCSSPTLGAQAVGCPEWVGNVTTGTSYGSGVAVASNPNTGPNGTFVYTPLAPGANVFQGIVSGGSVTFFGVPIQPPGSGAIRTYRMTNLRVNANGITGGGSNPANAVAAISISGSTAMPITNSTVTVGLASPSMQWPSGSITMPSCATSTICPLATLPFQELQGFATKPRTTGMSSPSSPPVAQNVPGQIYSTETGFYAPALGASVPSLATAGLADFGTRIKAAFALPQGVHLYAATSFTSSSAQAILTASETGPFSAVPSTVTIGGVAAAEIVATSGYANAVWEIASATPNVIHSFSFPLFVKYDIAQLPQGAINMYTSYAPAPGQGTFTLSAAGQAQNSTYPEPRFANPPSYQSATGDTAVNGASGSPFQYSVTAANSPTSFSVFTGSLPAGLTLNSATGAITGTPSVTGLFTATIAASNSTSTLFVPLAITIGPPSNSPPTPATWNSTVPADLIGAIVNAADGDTIRFNSDIYLTSDLPAIQHSITIDGAGHTLSGSSMARCLFIGAWTPGTATQIPVNVTIQNLTFNNCYAAGGNGAGGGGGGAGLGGAIFVANHANVTLANVAMTSNTAIGGVGGAPSVYPAGGGGGMGGAGSLSGGGGLGSLALGASSVLPLGAAGAGIANGAAPGGASGSGAKGGINGGGGGPHDTSGAPNFLDCGAGGGGVGGSAGSCATTGAGGNGGFGGGGGAGFNNATGTGGFGGGGGAGVNSTGANGGFGGGGGGGGGAHSGGAGGFGGGTGVIAGLNFGPYSAGSFDVGAGGGGLGAGGAIAVQQGGSLTIAGSLILNGNQVSPGFTLSPPATSGSAVGSGIFLQGSDANNGGSGSITFAPAAGQTQTVSDVIADQTGSGGTGANAGTWSIIKNGAGTLVLSGANTNSGPTVVNAGTLSVTGSLGNGAVTVASGATLSGSGSVGSVTLQSGGTLTGSLSVANTISLANGSILTVTLNGNGNYTQVASGTVDLTGGPTLNVVLGFTPTVGTTFTVIPGKVIGQFAGLPEGAVFAVGGVYFRIHYGSVQLTVVAAPPVITSSSTATAIYGTPFTYTITAGSPATYSLSTTLSGFSISSTTGVLSGTPTQTGTFSLTITATSSSGPGVGVLTLTVTKAPTTAALAYRSGSLVANIASTATAGAGPTGSIQFLNGGTAFATVAWNGSVAVAPAPASGTFTAVYSGDSNFNGATSNAVTLSAPATSTLSLASSVNPSTLGQPVSFTATVGTSGGSPSGTVQFFDNGKSLGTVGVSGGQATFSTVSLTAGQHVISATYSGDGTFPQAQASISQSVDSTLSVSATAAPASPVYSQAVVLTAALNVPPLAGSPSPTGQVDFLESGAILGSGAVYSGSAAVTLTSLAAGTHTITALYRGDATWPSAFQIVSVTVAQASTATSLSVSPGPDGQALLKAAVGAAAPATGVPTGAIQFVDTSNNTVLATAAVAAGSATASVPIAAANRPIAALYSGDANFKNSTSASLPVLVSAASVPAASFAPDELVSLYNVTGLAGDTPATLPLGPRLAGTSVTVTDSRGAANQSLLYGVFASTGQINFVIPGNTAAGPALLTITLPNNAPQTALVAIGNTAPGIFTASMDGRGVFAGQVIHAHADGSQTMTASAAFNAAQNAFVPAPISLGPAGDQVFLILYGTGLRHAASVTATVNGVSVPAVFAAQSQYPGLDQVNLQLPPTLAGAGVVNIIITADGQSANTVTAMIQ